MVIREIKKIIHKFLKLNNFIYLKKIKDKKKININSPLSSIHKPHTTPNFMIIL